MEYKRKTYLDIIKIVAIILVIFNHTQAEGFLAYQSQENMLFQALELLITCFSKVAVPLFFMCSGATLLGREESLKDIWKHRVLRMVLALAIFTFAYYVFLSVRDHSPIDLLWIFITCYSSTTFSFCGAYWFLYAYIGFLIMLPLLRLIAKGLNKELFNYLLVFQLLFGGLLPIFEYKLGMGGLAVSVPLLTDAVFFYPLIGYYVEQQKEEMIVDRRWMVLLSGMGIFSLIASTALSLYVFKKGDPTQNYFGLFQAFLVLFVFLLIYSATKKIEGKIILRKVLGEIGRSTFGIYLIHGFVFTVLNDIYYAGSYAGAWGKALIVFVISLLISWLLCHVPVVRKLF